MVDYGNSLVRAAGRGALVGRRLRFDSCLSLLRFTRRGRTTFDLLAPTYVCIAPNSRGDIVLGRTTAIGVGLRAHALTRVHTLPGLVPIGNVVLSRPTGLSCLRAIVPGTFGRHFAILHDRGSRLRFARPLTDGRSTLERLANLLGVRPTTAVTVNSRRGSLKVVGTTKVNITVNGTISRLQTVTSRIATSGGRGKINRTVLG